MLTRIFALLTAVTLMGCTMEQAPEGPRSALYQIEAVTVNVPADLRISEQNSYYPIADIVWRGEPLGDRRAQITQIYLEAAAKANASLNGPRDVDVEIEVTRFHALTEVARYTIGGTHSLTFILTLRDPKTGEVIDGPRKIKRDLEAYGGQDAIDADQRGETQRVRIVNHLAAVLVAELSGPAAQ